MRNRLARRAVAADRQLRGNRGFERGGKKKELEGRGDIKRVSFLFYLIWLVCGGLVDFITFETLFYIRKLGIPNIWI